MECANSSRLELLDGDQSFWTVDMVFSELENLLEYFKLGEGVGYPLLGRSWGRRLATVLATRRPKGVRRVILTSTTASHQLGLEGYRALAKLMFQDDHLAIQDALTSEDFQLPHCRQAMDYFYRGVLCRLDPYSASELVTAVKNLANSTHNMNILFDRHRVH